MGGVGDNTQTKRVSPERRRNLKSVLAETVDLVEAAGVPYVVTGTIASNHWGRPSPIGDLDFVVSPPDAKDVLATLEGAGYDTEERDPRWLYKAKKDDITVDLIFEMDGGIYLDDAMIRHASLIDFEGTRLRIMSAEDFVVNQCLSAGEDTPDYWYNALGVMATTDLDWDYVIERASRGPRRVLSALVYAQSNDLAIPDGPVRRLFEIVYRR